MKIDDIYNLRDTKLKELGFTSYKEYLLSDEWKNIKTRVRQRIARKWNYCNVCGSNQKLDLHHSSYKVLGQPNPGNTVKLLCRDCHNELHKLSKENPNLSFYKICGRMRSKRIKLNQPIFKYK